MDYNRAGQALLEIVSEPDMRSGQDAAAYGAEIRRIMVFLGVSDGEMSVSAPVSDVKSVKCLGDCLGPDRQSSAACDCAIHLSPGRQSGVMLHARAIHSAIKGKAESLQGLGPHVCGLFSCAQRSVDTI